MLKLFSGITAKVYITVILVLLVAGVFFYKAYTGELVEKGAMQTSNVTLQQNVEHVEKSASITDTVVKDYVEKTEKSHQVTEKLRKEAIHEYVKKISPVVPTKTPPATDSPPDGADRVGVLADRLHENYCRARPNDTRCHPVNPSP